MILHSASLSLFDPVIFQLFVKGILSWFLILLLASLTRFKLFFRSFFITLKQGFSLFTSLYTQSLTIFISFSSRLAFMLANDFLQLHLDLLFS